jgi:hypothetical protein
LTAAPLSQAPYMDLLIDLATNLVLAGHQRSLVQGLQEMGALPLEEALPPIQVFFLPGLFSSLLLTVCRKWREKKVILPCYWFYILFSFSGTERS